MINTRTVIEFLRSRDIGLFCGVPDSLLKAFCSYLTDHFAGEHVITANEGGAIGLAAGYYLATGRIACVYMQNSGQGNAVNPLCSLADPDVYSIPMLLIIGWRGMPGVHDEPQHVKQGKVTVSLFESLGIPTTVLDENEEIALRQIGSAIEQAKTESRPVALVVKKGLFAEYRLAHVQPDLGVLKREQVIEAILTTLDDEAIVISTTGMISREVYETRIRLGQGHEKDFLTVGSMGHALMIALGVARSKSNQMVVCLDGDGAALMQMGNLAIAGTSMQSNLLHIVLNNAAHDSVGGQPTVAGQINLVQVAGACGYTVLGKFNQGSVEDLKALLNNRLNLNTGIKVCHNKRTSFLEIQVAKGARADLGRPKECPQINKKLFMETLSK